MLGTRLHVLFKRPFSDLIVGQSGYVWSFGVGRKIRLPTFAATHSNCFGNDNVRDGIYCLLYTRMV